MDVLNEYELKINVYGHFLNVRCPLTDDDYRKIMQSPKEELNEIFFDATKDTTFKRIKNSELDRIRLELVSQRNTILKKEQDTFEYRGR